MTLRESMASKSCEWHSPTLPLATNRRREARPTSSGQKRLALTGVAICEGSRRTAALKHWTFEQLATIAGAPPKYLGPLGSQRRGDSAGHEANLCELDFFHAIAYRARRVRCHVCAKEFSAEGVHRLILGAGEVLSLSDAGGMGEVPWDPGRNHVSAGRSPDLFEK